MLLIILQCLWERKKKTLQQRIFWPKRSLRAEVEHPCAWHFRVVAAVSVLFSAGPLVPVV